MAHPDWSLIRSFLATARAGSLSAAARVLGISQPTLGRHIRSLEQQLGKTLFQREAAGLTLTPLGHDLLPMAQSMELAAAQLSLTAAAETPELEGTVRITASRVVAHYLLPEILAKLRASAPGLQIELVPSDTSENLLFQEADIALRMYRPTQPDLTIRHVADLPIGLYATPDLLRRHGMPETPQQLLDLPIVGFDRNDMILRMMANMGLQRTREDFPVRCDDQLVYWTLVRAGLGVGAMQERIGDSDPAVVRIASFVPLPQLPLWLATARPLTRSPRVRLVWDHLAAALRNPKSLDPGAELG